MSEPDPIAKLQSSFPSAVVPYSSLTELRKLWRAMDRREGGLKLTIVLVLGDSFAGFLPGLIRRQHPALRLVIAAPAGRLPGFIDEVDLAECTASLGFHMISVYPDAGTAVAEGNSPLAWQERCVTFMPAASQPILI